MSSGQPRSSSVTRAVRHAPFAIALLVATVVGTARAASPDAIVSPASPTPPAAPVPAATSPQAPGDACGGPGRLLATLNRPTIGYSPCAVPKGSFVLENGYQNQTEGGPSASTVVSYPGGFQRFGVADRLELDLIGPSYNRTRTDDTLTHGYGDLGLGLKAQLPQRGRFTYGVDALVTAATGSGGYSNGGPTQALNLDVAFAASPAIGLGTTLAMSSSAGFRSIAGGDAAGERFGFFQPSFVVTAQIPQYYQFYAEIVGTTKIGPGQGGRIVTDLGVQKLIGSSVEIDAEYGTSLTPVSGSRFHYVGFGAGVRVK
ncbi:MAG: hypothetical protein NVS1B2_25010 [Vulcanimicrobiaceae bacterium]